MPARRAGAAGTSHTPAGGPDTQQRPTSAGSDNKKNIDGKAKRPVPFVCCVKGGKGEDFSTLCTVRRRPAVGRVGKYTDFFHAFHRDRLTPSCVKGWKVEDFSTLCTAKRTTGEPGRTGSGKPEAGQKAGNRRKKEMPIKDEERPPDGPQKPETATPHQTGQTQLQRPQAAENGLLAA